MKREQVAPEDNKKKEAAVLRSCPQPALGLQNHQSLMHSII